MAQGLAAAVDELDDGPELSVAVLTGAGGNFCAGMDLEGVRRRRGLSSIPGRGIGFTERPPRKPLIAAVEGYALAGGTEVVLATDLVVASRTAKFGIPEVKRGLVAAGGGLLRLPHRIPYQKALELALTGDSFTAERGRRRGASSTCSPNPARRLAGALELAEKHHRQRSAGGRGDQGDHRQVGRVEPERDVEEAERAHQAGVHVKDAIEGATAFAEKRAPTGPSRRSGDGPGIRRDATAVVVGGGRGMAVATASLSGRRRSQGGHRRTVQRRSSAPPRPDLTEQGVPDRRGDRRRHR